jgi:hypothetical protein
MLVPGLGKCSVGGFAEACIAPGLKLPKVSKDIARKAYLQQAWSG